MAISDVTRIQLCGRLAVVVGDERVEERLPGRQGVLVLAFLVIERRRAVARHELAEVLWPEGPPPVADAGLRALLSKLRAVVGGDVLDGRDPLQLRLPAQVRIDVEDAEEAIHRAEASVERADWGGAWGPARVALLVSGRGLLPGYEAPWLDARRGRLADIERRALRAVALAGVGIGGVELDLAESAARRLVAAEPLQERAHRCLMEVLAARGDVAEALVVADGLRQRLRRELGVSPSPETLRLHQELVRASDG